MLKNAVISLFGVFAQKQTFLNLLYLLAGFFCGLLDLIIFVATWGMVVGLVAIPVWLITSVSLDLDAALKVVAVAVAGLLIIPASLFLWYFPALLEQRLAASLLHVRFPVRAFWAAPAAMTRYFLTRAAWGRFLFGIVRIPLGLISFVAVLAGLVAAFALLSLPLAYLAGFQGLVIGAWRINGLWQTLMVFLAALILAPLALHALNWLSRASGGLARACLQD